MMLSLQRLSSCEAVTTDVSDQDGRPSVGAETILMTENIEETDFTQMRMPDVDISDLSQPIIRGSENLNVVYGS